MCARAASNFDCCAKAGPSVSPNASETDISTPNSRRFIFCTGLDYRDSGHRKMTGSACGSAAVAAHLRNWQNNPTHARLKSRKTKKTSHHTGSKKPAGIPAGFNKGIAPNKESERPVFLMTIAFVHPLEIRVPGGSTRPVKTALSLCRICLLYTSPSPRD